MQLKMNFSVNVPDQGWLTDHQYNWDKFLSKYRGMWGLYDWQLTGKLYRMPARGSSISTLLHCDLLMPVSSQQAGRVRGCWGPLTGWTTRRRRGAAGGEDRPGSSTASSRHWAGSPAWSWGHELRWRQCTPISQSMYVVIIINYIEFWRHRENH